MIPKPKKRVCAVCKEPFEPSKYAKKRDPVFCGESCRKAHRRSYCKEYYRRNMESARSYQRKYRHKKKRKTPPISSPVGQRPARRESVTASDLLHAPFGKADALFGDILAGRRRYVGVGRPEGD